MNYSKIQSFGHVFQWCLERYRTSNKTERYKNRTQMEADWNYNNGVEALINHINTGLRYATLTRYPITDPETVNIANVLC